MWQQHLDKILPFIFWGKVGAALLLLEQLYEVAFAGVSLVENPTLAIACVGALAAPIPARRDKESK